MITDLAIIGAGPAGLSAAIEAAALGLSVTVIDEQPAPGGQIFRGVERAATDPALAGEYGTDGAKLVRRFRGAIRYPGGIDYRPSTTLWHLDTEAGLLSLRGDGGSSTLAARRVLLATGAQERPVPIPGWTLPNVMTAGAAQILLKQAGAVPQGSRTVLAGQGPLLWLLAGQLARAGAAPALLLETTPRGALRAALPAGGFWRGRAMLAKGAGLMLAARAAGMKVVSHVTGLRAEGDGILRRVVWDGGSTEAETLLLHEGVIPSTHVSRALGLPHTWDEAQRCWRPEVDCWGATPHPLLAVAGDGAGIGGWQAAVAGGALAALDAAHRLGRLAEHGRNSRAVPHRAALSRVLALRPFLDRLYAPSQTVLAPPEDATVVCRCEEITAGQVRAAAKLGATGPNQAKAYLRTGMGPCQGRMCGTTVAALLAEAQGIPIPEAGALRPRAPFKPITVGELADLPGG